MKEFTIEQKAQRYDEAIKLAKDSYNYPSYPGFIRADVVFPELKESEEEKIKKWIKKELESKYVVDNTVNNVMADKALAWLEKIGKQKPYGQRQECVDCQFNYAGECKGSCAMKRGKQKPDKVEPKFKNGQWIVWQNKCYKVNYNGCGYELIDQNGLSTSLEYVTVDENAHLWTIQDAKDGDVLASKDGNDILIFKNLDSDKCFSSYYSIRGGVEIDWSNGWSNGSFIPATKEQHDTLMKAIADAGYTFDFEKKELKKIEQKLDDARTTGYWHVEDIELTDFESALFTAFSDAWQQYLSGEEVNVAQWTKEHSSELLEAARKEHVEWSEEDEKMSRFIGNAITADDASIYLKSKGIQVIDVHVWLNELKERVLPQPKQEWSEVDELKRSTLIQVVKKQQGSAIFEGLLPEELIDWLESLKDRVQPKPQQKWSEEDEETLDYIIDYIEKQKSKDIIHTKRTEVLEGMVVWLKSLKYKYTWKPSKEQMGVIEAVINNRSFQRRYLDSLYQDLLKILKSI